MTQGSVAGIDFKTNWIDVVVLGIGGADWERYDLSGGDAFERMRNVPIALNENYGQRLWWLHDCVAIGIEEPQGMHKPTVAKLKGIQGAIVACLPRETLVNPIEPAKWKKLAGLPGNATKDDVAEFVRGQVEDCVGWTQDAFDAWCIAVATKRQIL